MFRVSGAQGAPARELLLQQLVVDLDFFGHPQAIGHLDDVDPVKEGLVVLVVAEGLPLGLVGVSQDDAVKRHRAHAFGGVVVAFLGGGQQRVQHLDRRLEHLHEFHQALVGLAQPAGEAVGVRVILGILLQHADVDLAHQRRNVLVVFITRLGLGDANLVEHRGIALDHPELADIAAVLVQALDRPGRHDGFQVALGNAVFLLAGSGRPRPGSNRPSGDFVHRRALDGIEGHLLHQRLELFRQRRFAAADRAEQIEDLLLLFQALGGVLEEGHDVFDGFFHAVELGEFRVTLDDLVGKDAGKTRVQEVSTNSGSPMAISIRSAAVA